MSTPTSTDDILTWARHHLADLLGTDPATVDPRADFDHLGVDSALAVSLLLEIEARYGVDVPPEALFENPTLAALAAIVHAELAPA